MFRHHIDIGRKNKLDKKGWSMEQAAITDHALVGGCQRLDDYLASGIVRLPKTRQREPGYRPSFQRIGTAVSGQLTVGDICVDPHKNSPWDTDSYYLMSNHNTEAMVRAMKFAHQTFFHPSDELKIPTETRIVRDIVDLVFTSDQPDKIIRECRSVLQQAT